jgi:hypothetical protein
VGSGQQVHQRRAQHTLPQSRGTRLSEHVYTVRAYSSMRQGNRR